jgi:hypothetical protein
MERAKFPCIRYRGTEREIQLRLVRSGQAAQCDYLPPYLRISSHTAPWWRRIWEAIRRGA